MSLRDYDVAVGPAYKPRNPDALDKFRRKQREAIAAKAQKTLELFWSEYQ